MQSLLFHMVWFHIALCPLKSVFAPVLDKNNPTLVVVVSAVVPPNPTIDLFIIN